MLEHVDVCSKRGRGIVAIDGGSTRIQSSYVHDCAATSIYVGGAGSSAVIHQTDVLRNGNGNRMVLLPTFTIVRRLAFMLVVRDRVLSFIRLMSCATAMAIARRDVKCSEAIRVFIWNKAKLSSETAVFLKTR